MGSSDKVILLPNVEQVVDLDYVRGLIDNLRKGDRAFLRCIMASEYIKLTYGVKYDAYQYCIDKKIEACKRAESYHGKAIEVSPPPLPNPKHGRVK